MLALGFARSAAEPVESIGADLTAVAMHQHHDCPARFDKACSVRADEVGVGGQVGIWRPTLVHGKEAWDVHLITGSAKGISEFFVALRDLPAPVDK